MCFFPLLGNILLLNIPLLLYLPSSAQKLLNLGGEIFCYDLLYLYIKMPPIFFPSMPPTVPRGTTYFLVLALSSLLTQLSQKSGKFYI